MEQTSSVEEVVPRARVQELNTLILTEIKKAVIQAEGLTTERVVCSNTREHAKLCLCCWISLRYLSIYPSALQIEFST